MADGICHPQPGDLIEIDRPFHQPWALYMGDGYVINVTPVGKEHPKLDVHGVRVFTRKVEKQCLKEVVQKEKWCVNNKCHQYRTRLPVEEIIRRAEDYIGKEVTCRVFGSNCEHFVTMLPYGEGVSWQAMDRLRSGYLIFSAVTLGLAFVSDSFFLGAAALAFAGAGLLVGIGLVSFRIADFSIFTKFMKKDILQQRCC